MVVKRGRHERDGEAAGSVIGKIEGAFRPATGREQRGNRDGCGYVI